jgi:hypothetical protein
VIVYATNPGIRRWIEEELAGENYEVIAAPMFVDATNALRGPEVLRQLVVVDLEALSPEEIAELQRVRDQGWNGRLVGLGDAREFSRGLRLTHAIPRPLGSESLRAYVSELEQNRDTMKLPKLGG